MRDLLSVASSPRNNLVPEPAKSARETRTTPNSTMLWGILCCSNRVMVSVYIVRVFLVHRTPSLLHPHLTVQQVMSPALPRDLARF